MASTCSYLRDAASANALWIRRCKADFGVKVDPGVAEESGAGSVFAFYLLIMDELGPFLGPLKRKNLEYYSGLYQLVHDGKLGLLCLQWVPPPPRLGLQLPMTLQKFFSVSLAGLEIGEQKRRCTPPSRWYQAVYKVRESTLMCIHLGTRRNNITLCTESLSRLRTMLLNSSSRPLPA